MMSLSCVLRYVHILKSNQNEVRNTKQCTKKLLEKSSENKLTTNDTVNT